MNERTNNPAAECLCKGGFRHYSCPLHGEGINAGIYAAKDREYREILASMEKPVSDAAERIQWLRERNDVLARENQRLRAALEAEQLLNAAKHPAPDLIGQRLVCWLLGFAAGMLLVTFLWRIFR